ncbi:MAG: hypothetical protein WCI93_02390 [bacterium]
MNKYLPSKKFISYIIVILILGIIAFLVLNFSPKKKFFFFSVNKEGSGLVNERATVSNILQLDTDGDSVPDWEETLWGTDKNNKATFNSVSDSVYIAGKKKDLNIDQTKDNQDLTETEKFAREFFATYVAMKTAGNSADAINNFSEALGQKIIYPDLIDSYTEKNIKINEKTDKATTTKYYNDLKKIFGGYQAKGIGDELPIVADGITSAKAEANNNKLVTIASAYQDFAKKIMEMSVPKNLTSYHLAIANGANNTGISILGMTKISSDPIIGLSSLSQYQKYSDALVQAVNDLETKI